MSSEFFLSTGDGTPMYAQIVAQIVEKVIAGDWPAGHALPSIRELASASQVSVITVKRAYLELERAGIIVTRHGKGSFVADRGDLPRQQATAEFAQHLDGLVDAARRLGMDAQEVLRRVRAALSGDDDTDDTSPTSRRRETAK